MSWTVTIAGETFTDANVAGTAYADEATGFPAILAAFAREAAFLRGLAATSATVLTPATGTVALVTHQDASAVGLSPGTLVRVASAADATRLMVGTVAAYAGTALTLDVIFAAGAAAADWVITRPTGGTSLALDPAPVLAADLDGNGRSITGLLNAALAGTLDVAGLSTLASTRFSSGDQWKVGELGTVAGTQTVGPGTAPIATVTLGADVILDHAAPAGGYRYWKEWEVAQDGTGGRTPTFRAADGTAAAWPHDDEPDWPAQPAAAVTHVVAYVVDGSTVRMFVGG